MVRIGWFVEGGEVRVLCLAGTFIADFYYDSQAEYERLQQIKMYTDPKDIFHTSFNVQLPG